LVHRYVLVVLHEDPDHVVGVNELFVVVLDGLELAYVRDAADGGPADASHALGQRIGGGEDHLGLLVEEKVDVAEAGASETV